MFCHVEWQVKKYARIYMQAHILLTNQERNRIVDACGLVCLTGYAALAWYSRGTTWAPALIWPSVPVLWAARRAALYLRARPWATGSSAP